MLHCPRPTARRPTATAQAGELLRAAIPSIKAAAWVRGAAAVDRLRPMKTRIPRRPDPNRAVRQFVAGIKTIGALQLAVSWASEMRFSLDFRKRAAARSRLAARHHNRDVYEFAQDFFPGNLTSPDGPSQLKSEILPMLDFAAELKPRTVVEIGTETGGTTFLFGAGLTTVDLLVGIDCFVRNQKRLRALGRDELELHFISADSASPATYARLEAILGGRMIDLLFIDGDHSFHGAARDFRTYRRLVRPGGLIAFHDIVPDSMLRSGVASAAWAGEVPLLWELLRSQYRSHEFVESWTRQEGSGIGLLEYDPEVAPQLVPARAMFSPGDGGSPA